MIDPLQAVDWIASAGAPLSARARIAGGSEGDGGRPPRSRRRAPRAFHAIKDNRVGSAREARLDSLRPDVRRGRYAPFHEFDRFCAGV